MQVQEWLAARGVEAVDCGVHEQESSDYPCYAGPLRCAASSIWVKWHGVCWCVVVGLGMSMAANCYAGIRAASC